MKMKQEGCIHQNRYTTVQRTNKKKQNNAPGQLYHDVRSHDMPTTSSVHPWLIQNMVINMQTRIFS